MKPDVYQQETVRTLSTSFHSEKVEEYQAVYALTDFIRAAKRLDVVKKALFYGKGPDLTTDEVQFKLPAHIDEVLFHAVVGIATEAGEMVEIVMRAINAEQVDMDHLNEEGGDLLWYMSHLFRVGGTSFEREMQRNIDKLRARFPEKFSEELAINRDVEAEKRAVA